MENRNAMSFLFAKKVSVKCPACNQRGQVLPADLVETHECPNCRQIVRLLPDPSHVRNLKFGLKLIGVAILFGVAIAIALPKL